MSKCVSDREDLIAITKAILPIVMDSCMKAAETGRLDFKDKDLPRFIADLSVNIAEETLSEIKKRS